MSAERVGTAAGVSRDAVLAALRSNGAPVTIEVLAQVVGLSVNTVRFHLGRLGRDGLATSEAAAPDGPGRPRMVYRAIAAEAVDGAAAYRMLAGLLAEGLARVGDSQATIEAGRSWAQRVVAAHDPSAGGSNVAEADSRAVDRVVDLFQDGGFAPELADDGRTIALRRCPFMELARVRADVVCSLHLGFARGVLHRLRDVAGANGRVPHRIEPDTVRLTPVLDGSGPCLVTLPADRPRSDAGPDRLRR
jgi:predicted ArsR family transcriptional regulator